MPTFDPPLFARPDIVVVPFPYAERLAEKRRPALVVSHGTLHDRFGLVWVAMITSAKNPSWDCDVTVGDLKGSGLPAPSVVRPAKIATIHSSRVIRRAGQLSLADWRAVEQELKNLSSWAVP